MLPSFVLMVFWLILLQEAHGSCGPVVNSEGKLKMEQSLATCGVNMIDPHQPVTHVKDFVDEGVALDVYVRFEFNNLVSVNELDNTASIDFFFRLWWQDIRWNMTQEFWDLAPLSVYHDGVELTQLISEDSDPKLPLWLPDLFFPDSLNVEASAQLLKLRPDGQLYWSRHLVATILQPDYDLAQYPNDNQDVVMSFESYAYTQSVMSLHFQQDPIGYISDSEGRIVLSKNPVWYHHQGDYATNTFSNDYTEVEEFPRVYQALSVSLRISRAGRGILVRYALPILILLILCAATFWANMETRIDTTMTILLSVSALYVVIIEGIPQVGYLTAFDDWIYVMYATLAMCVVLHQIVIVWQRKVDEIPSRGCLIRVVECAGRVLFAQCACIYYMVTFMRPTPLEYTFYVLILLMISTFIVYREWEDVRQSFKVATKAIKSMIDRKESPPQYEILFMNLVSFRKFSYSIKHHVEHRNRRERDRIARMEAAMLRKRKSVDERADSDDEEELPRGNFELVANGDNFAEELV